MALTQTLTDNFDDNSIDTGKWNNFGSGQVVETGQTMQITTTAAANYFTLYSQSSYDMTGSYVLAEVSNAGNQALTTRQTIVAAEIDANNKVYMQVGNNLLEAVYVVAGAYSFPASAAYNSTTHKWWRLREASGTTYWEYSSDGISWSTLHSRANPITMTTIFPYLQAGNYAAEASGSTSTFDNFNLPPSAVKRSSLSLTGVG